MSDAIINLLGSVSSTVLNRKGIGENRWTGTIQVESYERERVVYDRYILDQLQIGSVGLRGSEVQTPRLY